MTTRKRNKSSQLDVDVSRRSRGHAGSTKRGEQQRRRVRRRQHLLETLESRQLLAGPQLIGIQPNEGELIVDGTVRDTAPRSLTFRFDEDQRIAPNTFDAIRITRAGPDGVFDSGDDIPITPGSVSPGETAANEVVVRFAEALPNDRYRIDVFGFDDPGRDIIGLRNLDGELLIPRGNRASAERVEFDLRLGAHIEAIVPQPVVRVGNGLLEQRRNEILVYFNEDPLFVENDPVTGLPTSRSAENPRFYQLLLTEETVRTTDDTLYLPERVIYDPATFTSRLIFAGDDINTLPGVPIGGGTFRLRIGTAVDNAAELIIEPTQFGVVPRVSSNLGIVADLRVEFVSKVFGESVGNRQISFVNSGAGGLSVALDPATDGIVYDFGGGIATVQQLRDVTLATAPVDAVVSVSFSRGGIAGAGGGLLLPQSLAGAQPLEMVAAGDTLSTATDVGVFGQAGVPLSSLLISESIDPQTVAIQLPGAPTDPGRAAISSGLAAAINARFGPDVTDGITEIQYNFQGIFSGGVGTGFPAQLNNITDIQKRRVREAVSLWSQYVGVQFRETKDSGITFAVGTRGNLLAATGSELRELDVLNADLRIDPTFAESAMVFSSDANFALNYGEDFFRKAMTGIGFLLGLEQNEEATSQTLMSLDPSFLNGTINPNAFVSPVDPFISTRASYQQTINPNIDAQTIEDPIPNSLEGPEPVFPGNQDILHGSLLHRQDSIDVDLYRFEVSLSEGRQFGTLTVESFAERLPDSSLLDTSLTLFKDTSASATTSFGLGTALSVRVDSQFGGDLGNRSRIQFIQTDRAAGNTAIRVNRILGDDGRLIANAIEVDIPRRGPAVSSVAVSDVIDAINADPFASTLFQLTLVKGSSSADISGSTLDSFSPIRLSGGGTVPVARNDDYFSSDSLLTTKLSNGVYYIGVSSAGNDQYDPTLPKSGFGGRTQGEYQLLVKFEPQVSQTDVLRDLDSDRVGVPGTAIDGDLDGTPGGVKNFWFQTRPLERVLQITSTGAGIVPGQTITVTGANGVSRRFEFVPIGGTARPGNVPVVFQTASSTGNIAFTLAGAINSNSGALGVTAQVDFDPLAPGGFANVILSGERTLDFSTNFQGVEALGRTLFVDKLASVVSDGSLEQPFNNIASITQASAFASALPGDIVRIVGNGGQDADLSTPADNFAYQIGISEVGGNVLPDGRHMDVPKGVTAMVDAGAAFKLRSSVVSVGSNNLLSDRSGGALQVLGAPRLLELTDPSAVGAATRDVGIVELGGSGNVVFTSTRDRAVDAAASSNSPAPADGNWGGLIFRSDFDRSEGRFNREDEGIFLQVVNHADIRFGGGSNILINSVQQTVNPIQMIDSRPTITFNTLTNNASAAMSASPDAFLETRFQAPRFQQAGAFTAEYGRVGPDIRQNRVVDNSINGLFIRTLTSPNQSAREITVAARIDDVDIVHYIAENVVIAGRPGGPIQDGFKPNVASVAAQTSGGGSLAPNDYQYRITFVDASGFESLPSDPTDVVTTTTGVQQVQLLNLPVIPSGSDYRTRRLYRVNPVDGQYRLVAQLNRSESTFTDDGTVSGGAVLDVTREGIRGRLDGSLVIDPNTVVKFRGARIELGQGAQLLAEGLAGQRVVFTSALDDRFGAGGSFDTNEDADSPGGGALPKRGDWSGIYASPTAHVSFDHAVVAYGGGVSPIEGGQTRGFAALELQQASARVTNSRFEYNDFAQDGSGPIGRNGRLSVTPATIYARFTQPIIVGNQFVDNHGSIIDIDLASLTDEFIIDSGRQTGDIDAVVGLEDNVGPLVRGNTTESVPGDVDGRRQMNGLRVRAGDISTATVLDDTDIAHVLYESIVVGNQVSSGGLTLKSRPGESLVVKMLGRGTPNSPTAGTGITATGSSGDISDRIGGTVHVLGLPGAPVVLTSLLDDSVGAGRKIDGTALTDTNGDGFGSRPNGNDWRSLFFDGLSNDRNVKVVVEQEPTTALPPGLNSTVNNAQTLGDLAEFLTGSDDELRLGFEVNGFISAPADVDTYAFGAAAGTQVWIDLDRTSLGLDTMIEIVDDAGRVLARSDSSSAEINDPSLIDVNDPTLLVDPLGSNDNPRTRRWANGGYYDDGSTNLRDAGLRVTLPGVTGTRSDYFVRVRSASTDPDDIAGGRTSGAYQFQIRLQEAQEYPGSVVRHADIRYANHGIHVQGLPGSSPLVGEAQENESADPFTPGVDPFGGFPITGGYGIDGEPRYPTDIYAINDDIDGGIFGSPGFFPTFANLNSRPQNLGDLVDSRTGTISVGGELSSVSDVDFYQIDIDRDGMFSNLLRSTAFDIDFADGFDRPDTNISVFYSASGNPNSARLVLFGESSNVLDDLSSPIETQLIGELLERGSISENDPMIGPVALPAGSYFIAITESGRTPLELTTNTRVRRSPIDSAVRIFDDHIDVVGGATAQPPREREFVGNTSSGWSVTNNRALDPGHQRQGPIGFQGPQNAASPESTQIGSSVPDSFGAPTGDYGLRYDTHRSTPAPIDLNGSAQPPGTVASPPPGVNSNPTRLLNLGGFLSGPSNEAPLDIALGFLDVNSTELGLVASDLDDIQVTDQYVSDSTGVTHIYLRQTYGQLEVIGADININITADGEVINVGSSFVAELGSTGLPDPDLTAVEALDSLAAEFNWDLDAYVEVLDPAHGVSQMTLLAPSGISLDPIPAELAYVATGDGDVELVWNLIVAPPGGEHWFDASVSAVDGELLRIDDWVAHAQYNVFAVPLEGPQDGNRTLEVDPQDPLASPFGWHDTDGVAGAEFTDTRGNNVFAQEDTDADNAGGFRPDGGAALSFDFPLNLPSDPATYQEAAITNLFYVNNIAHDIHYHYGFDEASGNFQENNYGNGGLGGDPVQADAQDGSGTNNANFATPPDGIPPRMQQFIFTFTNPARDSDLSNSIIVHEFGHGVTNRLTGGPANSGALQAVQSRGMGEGWSDFYSLMFGQKTTDAQGDAYPVGNWVLGQPPTGGGIRTFPYSYDMSINPLTYGVGNVRFPVGSPHAEGEIWASALWDLNWLLINGDLGGPNPFPGMGFDPDLYNGTGGNNVALQLVMDGLKLQPANPSFLDARDAILLADQLNYGGANFVAIWTAFARRGMGFSADDGGSGNSTVVVEAFDLPPFPDPNNASIHFDRSEAMGTLTSASFDLTGYSAADLPRFYFDYFVDLATNDVITVEVSSNEQPTPVPLGVDLNDYSNVGTWRQAIASLEQFAGDTGITIEFTYDTDLTDTTAEGLYLDNFLIGFAERGESISGAAAGSADFTPTSTGTPGRYQLEIRPATEYTAPLDDGVLIERSRANDPKLVDPIWMTIPSGRGIVRYETFDIDVLNTVTGFDETLTFQFQPTEAALQDPSLVDPAAIPVDYSRADTSLQIVASLATAIRGLDDYAFFNVRSSTAQLVESFDTNDRHAEQTTLVAPAASQISDGDRFTLSDGSRTVTFEFSTDSSVTFGNIRIPYTAGDSSAVIARRMIEVINSGSVQGNLKLRASAISGEWDFNNPINPEAPPSDSRVAIHGTVIGNFDAVAGLADAPAPGTPLPLGDDGALILSAIFHSGVGDQNTVRTQGQVIVENNSITEVRAIGIWSDPGHRGTDPEDLRNETLFPLSAGTNYLQLPPVGNSPLGGVINFPELNDSVEGGLTPGLVAQNNIIDRAGYTGIKVDGDTRPFVVEWNQLAGIYASGNTLLSSPGDLMIPDGFIFAIDAGGTRVVFEFEDISGAPVNLGGSGEEGGDGFVDGHVPVYYRLGEGTTYNPSRPDPVRSVGHTSHEVMMSLYESIQGSILVTNGLVELVHPTLGPSLTGIDAALQQAIDDVPLLRPQILDPSYLDWLTPALYLEGVTGIYASQAFQKQTGSGRTSFLNLNRLIGEPFEIDTVFNFVTGETSNAPPPLMPIAESPQPLAKLVNNTVRGSDGTEGAVLADGSLSPAVEIPTDEPNDTIAAAVDTKLEVSHRGGYFADGVIGDNVGLLPDHQDVDFYKVELSVGDRLIVDMNTLPGGPTTLLRVLDSSGIEVVTGEAGALPTYLKPGSTVEFPQQDNANPRDSFIDFTALKKDTYYVGVSSEGNDGYEAKSLAARTDGTGGTGDYNIAIEVLAPRSFVFSLDNHPLDPFGAEQISGNINGTYAEGGPAGARSLVGTTFTISQIPDYLIPTRPGDAYAGVNAVGNRVTFEFTNGVNSIVLGNGNINVPILTTDFLGGGGYRVPDIMRSTAHAINGYLNNPAIPNHEVGNGPDGGDGPIKRVDAQALGGSFGDNVGVKNLQRANGCDLFLNIDTCPFGIFGSIDFPFGFGHDRLESGNNDIVPNGTFTDSRGSTELYVLIENAAKIELSPEARAAGLKLGPDNSRLANGNLRNPDFATESDQLLVEQGIHVGSGASAAILNNVVVNTHQSMVKEESSVFGFGGRIDHLNRDTSVKQGSVVASGNAFQYDDYRNTQMRSDVSWWVGFGGTVNRNPALDGSLSTDLRTGPSNIAGGNSDFNFVVNQPNTPGQTPGNFITFIGDDLLEDGAAGRFTPSRNAAIIDSAVDSLQPNVDLATLNGILGIPTNAITAPNRDHSGQLRADEPTIAPPGGIGANVFKDRGALDLADFVGPIAVLESPLDNDFAGSDSDPSASFVNRSSGVFSEFRILVQDLGDDSDPFVGSGVDDSTVVVSEIDGLRKPGANIALFENDRLLEEGIDYTFSYDESRGVITLTPLAGIWRNDRSYRIQVNNRDRTVLIAPDPSDVSDGDQLSIVDSDGATLVFEFESGFSLIVPEVITLAVPREGTNAGGLSDGDIFQIDDGTNPVTVFEFNRGDATLPGTIPVDLPLGPTPTDPAALVLYLQEIASNIATKVQSVVDAGDLDVDVRLIGDRVIIGGEPGTRATTSSSGLDQLARTLALQVPEVGTGVGGIVDGDTFSVNNGTRSVTFEFDTGNGLNNITNAPIAVGGLTPTEVALAIRDAVANSGLGLNALIEGNGLSVYLNLPTTGSASVTRGQLTVVGLSRPATDGDTIIITPNDGSAQVTLEINRTDVDPAVTPPNVPVDITRSTTANELAGQISNVILGLPPIAGLTPDDVRVVGGGLLAIGGDEGLGFAATGTTFEVTGSPSVTGASSIQVFGPLLLTLPLIGGGGIADGSVIILTDDVGNDVIFEFNLNNTQPTVAGSIVVPFDTFSSVDVVANNLSAAINTAGIGITAQNQGVGRVSLGRIDQSRVNINGLPGLGIPGVAGVTLRRGIVNDGEVLSIRQGSITVNFEFDAAVNGGGITPGNVPVAFQRGSTVGDVAVSLAAAINNNSGGLNVQAVAELDGNNVPTGVVLLNDQPGTIIDVFQAPTLNVIGVPGGATPINITPGTSAIAVKQALLAAIDSVASATTLRAADRGGATFFVENGQLFEGPLATFYLPAVKDLVGNPIKPNREDNTTQFTILLPTVGLDYADAPDPRGIVSGQYPTLLANDGARHVITNDLMLGSRVDAEPDAQVTTSADGDDLIIGISSVGTLFNTSVQDGFAEIQLQSGINPATRDGDTITLTLGDRTVTLELDTDGIFKEENFAIAPSDPTSAESVAQAIPIAISQSGLNASEVEVDGDRVLVYSDDEDGVSFVSYVNPRGNLNKQVVTPISVTVTGGGVLEAWVDFNADGDWNDPGEQIIERSMPEAIFRDTGIPFTRVFDITVPDFASPPPTPQTTYARFRVSREGGLGPNGLALSGEVEDYAILILPDSPPVIGPAQAGRTYTVQEDASLLVLDADATGTVTSVDDGILVGVSDPDGDPVAIYQDDVGMRALTTDAGEAAGVLTVNRDGTFTFIPEDDFNGVVTFSARVTDVKPLAPETELVNSTPLQVTINVTPVNDPPVAKNPPVLVSFEIDEDVQTVFTGSQLIDPYYDPGLSPNEAGQLMVIESVGSSNGAFTTELGGTVFIASDGRSVTYTPPTDFSSDTVKDQFTYSVADRPGIGQLSEVSATTGLVEIKINPLNDAPRPGADTYTTLEDSDLTIPIFGATGILANDVPGPQAEIDDGQTVSFVSSATTTLRGGTVTRVGDDLIYSPPALFSGQDQFTYTVEDNLGLRATGTVSINIGGINNPPNFIGINGDINETQIDRNESKPNSQQATYDLTTWFEDPEGDALTFAVVSSNPSVVPARVVGNLMILDFPAFTPGTSTLSVTATDIFGAPRTTQIPVSVADTADPPTVIGTLDPLSGTEDQPVTVDLTTVFDDPDVQQLQYSVAQLGNVFNPTEQQIALHPLVDAITFVGDQMQISLKPDQSGQVNIKISASDGSFTVSDSFTLTVAAVPDRPIAEADEYVVPVGASLQVLNPSSGLLRNDSDADGDPISIDLATVTSPLRGTLDLQADGTFTYTNTSGTVNDQDSFSYRIADGTGRFSDPVTVTLTLNRSRYQNPLASLANDVNADGKISAIDALRVINFLSRSLTVSGGSSVPVSEIGSPPPDYYDTNGDGRVSANDALLVINELGRQQIAQAESVANFAVTSSFAAASTASLPIRNVQPASEVELLNTQPAGDPRDALLAGGVEIGDSSGDSAVEVLEFSPSDRSAEPESVDQAISLMMDEINLDVSDI